MSEKELLLEMQMEAQQEIQELEYLKENSELAKWAWIDEEE